MPTRALRMSGFWPVAFLLVLLNTSAHFVPPERSALAPDDYSYVAELRDLPLRQGLATALANHERPVQMLMVLLQVHVVGDDARLGLMWLWASGTLLLVAVAALLRELLGDGRHALLGAGLFALLPQKLETYHTLIVSNANLPCTLYVLAWWAYLRHARTGRAGWLGLSLAAYALAVPAYEVGFFLPLLLALGSQPQGRHRAASLLPFALIAGAYLGWRLITPPVRAIGLSERPLMFLFHHYLGFFAAQSLASGLRGAARLDAWALFAALLDAAWLVLLARHWGRLAPERLPARLWANGATIFAVFLLPLLARGDGGGVAARHLVLPSIGVALCLLAVVRRLQASRALVLSALALLLVVSQGNTWMQVIACRISAATYATLREQRVALQTSTTLVIDRESFRNAVPATWLRFRHDYLNQYYGAQVFEDWGLRAMARLAAGRAMDVVFAVDTPARGPTGDWRFTAGEGTGGRGFRTWPRALPAKGTLILGFSDVYPHGFGDGSRAGLR